MKNDLISGGLSALGLVCLGFAMMGSAPNPAEPDAIPSHDGPQQIALHMEADGALTATWDVQDVRKGGFLIEDATLTALAERRSDGEAG